MATKTVVSPMSPYSLGPNKRAIKIISRKATPLLVKFCMVFHAKPLMVFFFNSLAIMCYPKNIFDKRAITNRDEDVIAFKWKKI